MIVVETCLFLVFIYVFYFTVVHGIGAACDIKFRPIDEVVDGFRSLAADISEKHFAAAHLASRANRVEFLPVSWHDSLHGAVGGTDGRLAPLTLRSIPKLRTFVNDTLLDVLFYTSPLYCQTILDTGKPPGPCRSRAEYAVCFSEQRDQ